MSARILAPKPLPGPLAARLEVARGLGRDRRKEKAEIHAEHGTPGPFNYRGIEITVESVQVVRLAKTIRGVPHEAFALECNVTASRGGVQLAIDGHLLFHGPPLLVQDGTHRIESIDGKDVEIANHREDPRAALCEVIGQTVMGQLK